jgi:hypothetical protein
MNVMKLELDTCLQLLILWLVSSLSPSGPGFVPRLVRVGFVMDRVALGQVFLQGLRFPRQYHPINAPYSYEM